MIFLLANTAFLILSIGYGWLAGDRLDKQAAAWIIGALLGTLAATTLAGPALAVPSILVVDIILLIAITRVALASSRYWPTWFAGLHLAGVACGAVALLASPPHDAALRVFAGFWGVPALLVMVFGLFLDRRAMAKVYAQPST